MSAARGRPAARLSSPKSEASPPVRRRSVYADRLLGYPEFVFLDGRQFAQQGIWRQLFSTRIGDSFDGRVIFEIGCNDAAFLTRIAAKHPTTAFIGVDWKCRALHTAAERVAGASLKNVALLNARGQDIARIFGEGELDEIWIFHPDPCDRPRELPNRLLAQGFLKDADCVLRCGGSLVLKTDHRDYFDSTLALLPAMAGRFDLAAQSTDFWNDREAAASTKCFTGETTAYEARFRKKRQPICYLELRKR